MFLATLREIAIGWVLNLRDKVYAAVHHKDRTGFIAKSVELALICALIFDIDDQYLERLLAGKNNALILLQTSIVI